MNSKQYSPAEIDQLRDWCENKYLYGEYYRPVGGGSSRTYYEAEKVKIVEEQVRTLIAAGVDVEAMGRNISKAEQAAYQAHQDQERAWFREIDIIISKLVLLRSKWRGLPKPVSPSAERACNACRHFSSAPAGPAWDRCESPKIKKPEWVNQGDGRSSLDMPRVKAVTRLGAACGMRRRLFEPMTPTQDEAEWIISQLSDAELHRVVSQTLRTRGQYLSPQDLSTEGATAEELGLGFPFRRPITDVVVRLAIESTRNLSQDEMN